MKSKIFTARRVRLSAVAVVMFAFLFSMIASVQPLMGQGRQLSLADILIALRSKKAEIDEKNRILADAVKERGITFALTPEIEKELDSTGARNDLISAIRSKAALPPSLEIKKADPPKVEAPAPKPVSPPQDFAFFSARAATASAAGNNEAAISDLTKALEFKPEDVKTILSRALIYLRAGRSDVAYLDFEKAANLDPKNAIAQSGRAQILEKDGKVEAAISSYEKAFEFDPADQASKTSAQRLRNTLAEAAKKAAPSPAIKPPAAVVAVGPLNPYATSLATPVYSAMDRRLNIFGRVTVQISLDETGKVTSVGTTEGAKSLRASAEEAVRRSKFRPIKVGETPVKATGFIIFNFVNQ